MKPETESSIRVAVAPLLVDAKTACQMLGGISRKTLYNMLNDGRLGPLPVRALGRRVLWRAADLSQWVASGCPCRDIWIGLQKNV